MKNRILYRLTAFVLSVLLISVSAGNAFVSTNDISYVRAVVPAVMGADMMYEICHYLGSVYLGYTSTREMSEVNIHNDDVARIGYQVNKTLWEYGFYDGPFHDTPLGHSAVMAAVDYYGQQYVWGSEAFQQIVETEFTVIQGGKNDNDDDDDDDDEDNIIHFPKKDGNISKLWFAFTATAAAGIAEFISSDYQDWLNGEPDTILGEWLDSFNDTFSEYESIQNYDGTYNVMAYCWWHYTGDTRKDYIGSGISTYRPFAVGNLYSFQLAEKTDLNDSYKSLKISRDYYVDGVYRSTDSSLSWGFDSSDSHVGTNVPIFSTFALAFSAFEADDFSSALNYAKTYRIADWLEDDEYWKKQKLIDPLTGLNALSNWYNIVRHQGLNALGTDATADDLADYIRDYFAQLGTDILPEVDPSQAPIKFPADVEDVIIDPAVNPSVYPASGTNPGTGTDPTPGVDPNPGTDTDPTPGVVDIPIEDIVPSVNDSFIDVAGSLRYKFPFSIPWDIQYMLSCLAETPKAPRFELPIVIDRYGIDEKIIIEMSMFQTLSDLSRSLFSMLFAIFLVNLTFKVVGMRKEE